MFKGKINESIYNTEEFFRKLMYMRKREIPYLHETKLRDLTLDEAIFSIDQHQHIYENLDTINGKTN